MIELIASVAALILIAAFGILDASIVDDDGFLPGDSQCGVPTRKVNK